MQEITSSNNDVFIGQQINDQDLSDGLLIPLALCCVSAGFPSPADDYIESAINLNYELIKHPLATFYVCASGDSMIDVGIMDKSKLIIDRQIEARSGDIVLARIGDGMCVRQLFRDDENRIFLLSRNENYKPLEITEDMDFEIWGKVTYSITKH